MGGGSFPLKAIGEREAPVLAGRARHGEVPLRADSVVMPAAGREREGFVVPPAREGCEPPSCFIRGSGC